MNVDQIIDKKTVAIPGPIGDVTPAVRSARDDAVAAKQAAEAARDEAVAHSAAEGTQLDTNVAGFLTDATSESRKAVVRVVQSTRWYSSLRILCIGDSFGDENMNGDRAWTRQLRALTGAVVYSECVSGTGFARPGYNPTFLAQLQAFHAAHPDAGDIDVIIIAGGVNDPDDFSNNLGTAIQTTLAYARSTWPQARILVVPQMAGRDPITKAKRTIADYMLAQATQAGCETVPWAWTWRIGRDDLCYNDLFHPNADGAQLIAKYLMQAIGGNYHGRCTAWYGVNQGNGVFLQARGQMGKITLVVDQTLAIDGDGLNSMSWSLPASCGLMTQMRGVGTIITRNGDYIGGLHSYWDGQNRQLMVKAVQQPIAGPAVVGKNAYNGQTFTHTILDW